MKIEMVALNELKPDKRNARKHGRENIQAIKDALTKFGQHAPLVVRRKEKTILAGNGRFKAMKELGWKEAAVFYVDDDDKTALARALADNRTAELAEWDDSQLLELLQELNDFQVPGFDSEPEPLEDIVEGQTEVAIQFSLADYALSLKRPAPWGIPELRADRIFDQHVTPVVYDPHKPTPDWTFFIHRQDKITDLKWDQTIYSWYCWDYRFASLWTDSGVAGVTGRMVDNKVAAVVEPNFSNWADTPLAESLYNVYRSRLIAPLLAGSRSVRVT